MSDSSSHIALFVPSLRGGGAEKVMLSLASAFSDRGQRVDLVLVNAEGPYLKEVPSTIRIVNLHASRVIASLFGLMRYLRQERPDAMISALSHANIVAILACRIARIKTRLMVSEHTTLTSSVKNQNLRRGRWLPFLMRRFYPHADAVVAVSTGVADDLAKRISLPREHIRVIYNPIFSDHLLRLAQEDIVEPWFAPEMPPVLVAAGRLTRAKGFEILIKAFAQLRKNRKVLLMILGEGSEHSTLQNLIKEFDLHESVRLAGFKSNPIAYMKRAAAFVLSSRWEGFGNVLVEAMACGTPVISTDCPSGPAEILENGKWGRLVPMNDVDALAQAMEATLDESAHPDVAKRAQDFSIDAAVDQYLSVLGFYGS
jgi:glycosyltransferase involved in cell wall biosynthesis